MRTKEQLVAEINRRFGLVAVLTTEREIGLYTPTNVRIMTVSIRNAGTDEEPQWHTCGVGTDYSVLPLLPLLND